MSFPGPEYDPTRDEARLLTQIERICQLMSDGVRRSLREIEAVTGDSTSSISAQLRNLRKEEFGGHRVDIRRRQVDGGTHERRLSPSSLGLLDGKGRRPPRPKCPHCDGCGRLPEPTDLRAS